MVDETQSNTTENKEGQEVEPIKRDEKGRWVKGNPPGPGRKPGKTMKEYAKDYLSKLTEEEKDQWLDGLPKETVWKMAEGQPHQSTDTTVELKPSPLLNAISNNISNSEDSQSKEEN